MTAPAATPAPPPPLTAALADPAAATGTTAPDLFGLARRATEARVAAVGGVGVFARARRLLATGAWRGPRDAADSYVEGEDLAALAAVLGPLPRLIENGVDLLVTGDADAARAGHAAGLRVWWRLGYRRDDDESRRARALREVLELRAAGLPLEVVWPTPHDEPMGLDTLALMTRVRLEAAAPHLGVDFARIGPRLAQMSLAFGADLLFGPIVAERALRLGDNAHNPAMTRKEAATLLRGAGLLPHERLGSGRLEEVLP